ALEVAQGKVAAAARQGVQNFGQMRVNGARRRGLHRNAPAGAKVVEAALVDDPVARQLRHRGWVRRRVGRKVAENAAGETREVEQQLEVRVGKYLVVRVPRTHHAVPEPVGGRRK